MPKPEQKKENLSLRVDLDYGGDLVHDAPVRDGTTMPLQIDSKRRKKLKQKKTSLGHAEDDHEDWDMKQEL